MPHQDKIGQTTGTREALLDAAVGLLERDGLDAVTLRALGAAAGLSRGAAYRHFADKDDLLAAVATAAMRELRDAMTIAAQQGPARHDPVRRLEAVLRAYVDSALRSPARYQLIYGKTLNRREHPELKAEGAATYDLLLRAVQEGQAVGVLANMTPSMQLADLLWSTAHGLLDLRFSAASIAEKGPGDPHALIRLLVERVSAAGPAAGPRRPTS